MGVSTNFFDEILLILGLLKKTNAKHFKCVGFFYSIAIQGLPNLESFCQLSTSRPFQSGL
jgi:hypothetical protein